MTASRETPSSPIELVSLQKGASEPDPDSFFEKVGKLVFEDTPCLCEMQAVSERLIALMLHIHEETISEQADELTDWTLATWKKDKKRLKKALALVRDVH
jgi:hypothetical protein